MKKFIYLLTALAALNLGGQVCSAEIKTFHAESSYRMDKGEPIKIAQETAFNEAVRKISEEASVAINRLSVSRDSELEFDRIENFTAAILRVKSKTFGKEFTDDGGLKITVTVDAEIDTDNAAEVLNELREARNSAKNYEEVLKNYTERKNNFNTVYGEYLGSYQKRIMRKIRDGCNLEMEGKLDEALKLYDAVGVHYVKAVMAETSGNKIQAAQEYRAFVKDADIVYYDLEIISAPDRIVELEEAN